MRSRLHSTTLIFGGSFALVDTLRQSAQLVIITHQQQTMGAADILYGVTMEPGESSLIVAKRLVDSVV